MKSNRHLALVEQALISGGNFVLYLYAARTLPKEDWGELSLSLGLILVIQGFQRAFVTIPMVTSGGDAKAFSVAIEFWKKVQFLVTVTMLLGLLICYVISALTSPTWVQHVLVYAMALLVPAFYQEFVRRTTVMSLSMTRLVWMASAYAITLTISMIASVSLSFSSQPWAFVITLAGASVSSFAISGVSLWSRSTATKNGGWSYGSLWRFGRWAAASSLAYTGYNFAIQGLLAAISGPIAAGTFAATRNLTQPVNTLIQAIDTVDKPRAGRAFAADGMPGLSAVIHRSWGWMLLIAVPYLILIFAFSDSALSVLYGTKYQDGGSAVQLWCLVVLAMIFAQPLETGLYVVRRPDWLFYGRMASALSVLAAAPWLIERWSFNGALSALFSGWTLAGVCAIVQLRMMAGERKRK